VLLGAGGSTAPDTNLYRDAANSLKTDDALAVTGVLNSLGPTLGVKGYASLMAVGNGTITATGTTDIGWGAPSGSNQMRLGMAGKVMAISISLSAARSAGTLSAQCFTSSLIGPAAVIDGTNTQFVTVAATEDNVQDFTATSLVRVRLTGASFGPTAAVATVIVWVKPL
jgi:hypothetical protein